MCEGTEADGTARLHMSLCTLVNVKARDITTTNWCGLNYAMELAENGGKGKHNLYLFTL